MKVLFLVALLVNIVFFLWEVNSGVLNPQLKYDEAENEAKQIWLVSELKRNEEENRSVATAKKVDLKDQDITNTKQASTITEPKHVQKELLTVADKSPIDRKTVSSERKPEQESNTGTEKIASNSVLNIKNLVSNDKKDSIDNTLPVNTLSKILNPSIDNQKTTHQTASLEQNLAKVKNVNPLLPNNTENTIKQTHQEKAICYQIGPFSDIDRLERWRQFNQINPVTLKQFKKKIQSVSSYLVYYPAAETFAKSKENVLMLKRKGINDLWLFRSSELKGTVSLGLFTEEDKALSLKEKLVQSGLDVEIMQRYKTESVLYAQILSKDNKFKEKVVISKLLLWSECK